MRSTAFHAIAVTTEVLEEIRDVKETVKEALIMMQTDIQSEPPTNHANLTRTTHDDKSSEILFFLKKLQDEVRALKLSKNKNTSTIRKCKRTDQYCRLHGACAHQSKDCKLYYCKNWA